MAVIDAGVLNMELSSSQNQRLVSFIFKTDFIITVVIFASAFLRSYFKTCEQAGKTKPHIIFDHEASEERTRHCHLLKQIKIQMLIGTKIMVLLTLYIKPQVWMLCHLSCQDINEENFFNPKQHNTNDGHHLKKGKIDFNVDWKGERKCVNAVRQDSRLWQDMTKNCANVPFSPQSIQFMLQRMLTASNTTPEDHLYTKRLHVILAVSLAQLSSFQEYRKTNRQLWAAEIGLNTSKAIITPMQDSKKYLKKSKLLSSLYRYINLGQFLCVYCLI